MKIYNSRDEEILDIEVDDSSYRNRVLMGEYSLTLKYSLPEFVELPTGAWCEFEGERYTLERPEAFKMQHTRQFDYTVIFEADQAKSKKWKFRNTVDGRLKFSLTAKPHEHLEMLVENLNRREPGWTIGTCIEGGEKTINYDHAFCYEAGCQMATEFETEIIFERKTVSLYKVEHNKDNPLELAYGRGNGFKPGTGRSNYGDTAPIEILYPQAGSDNIDKSEYGSLELHLPKNKTIRYDGNHFEDEEGFDGAASRTYVTDADGRGIRRGDKEPDTLAEDSLDCTDIYPKREGEVTSVIEVDRDKHFYDFIDNTIPQALDYSQCRIEGETMTVIFQTGMLAGRELEITQNEIRLSGYKHAERRFELVPQEIDGETMPNQVFKPAVGDKYVVFHCRLPQAYIADNATKTGAEWDLFRKCVKYLYEHEEERFTFTGTLDGIWAKRDWLNIGGKIRLGAYVRFTDERYCPDGALIRITAIKDYINNPHSPEITLNNETISAGFSSVIKTLQSQTVEIEDAKQASLAFTKRRFRDARETMTMLEQSLIGQFTGSIQPIALQTMQLLAGDESLQFRFVNKLPDGGAAVQRINHTVTWNAETKQLTAEAGILQHMTIGINTLSSTHAESEYRFWTLPQFTSAVLTETGQGYYLYAKVSKTGNTGEFVISRTSIGMEDQDGFYHLLCGILNSEYEGERSFVSLHGFTEILPGRVTTDRIVSNDGESFLDLATGAMKLGDSLAYNEDGTKTLILKFLAAVNSNLGGWIFRDNKLISQEGKINGSTSQDYENEEFIPNITLDGVNGKIKLGNTVELTSGNAIVVKNTDGTVATQIDGQHINSLTSMFGSGAGSTSMPSKKITISASVTHAQINEVREVHIATLTSAAYEGVIKIPSITLQIGGGNSAVIPSSPPPVPTQVRLALLIDGVMVEDIGAIPDVNKRLDISRTFSINHTVAARTTHSIDLRVTYTFPKISSGSLGAECQCSEATATLEYEHYLSRYFANGLAFGISNEKYFGIIVNNAIMEFIARNGNYGLRLTSGGVQITTDGATTWKQISSE